MSENGESEDDYMSDAFLTKIVDVKPGLSTSRINDREKLIEVKSKANNQLQRQKQAQVRRDEGMATPVSSDNKGFGLMMKMGFKPGTGLGKNSDGRETPIPVVMLEERSGLGLEANRKRQAAARLAAFQKRQTVQHADFREAMALRFRMAQCQRQFVAAQHVCYRLDCQVDIKTPDEIIFWPENALMKQLTETDKPKRLGKLRTVQLVKKKRYDQGGDRPENLQSSDESLSDEDGGDNGDSETDGHFDSDKLGRIKTTYSEADLLRIVAYLRSKHFYCFWCGAEYENADQLDAECPGLLENDHT